jgi:Spy/CpxP family protein refolding chaperone
MAEELGLTEDQKAQIEQIRESSREDAKPLRDKVKDLRKEMLSEWQASVPDEGTLLDLHKEIHDVKGELGELRIQTRLDVINLLTPEQREKMKANMKNRKRDGKGREFKDKRWGKDKKKKGEGRMKGKGVRRGSGKNTTRSPQKMA